MTSVCAIYEQRFVLTWPNLSDLDMQNQVVAGSDLTATLHSATTHSRSCTQPAQVTSALKIPVYVRSMADRISKPRSLKTFRHGQPMAPAYRPSTDLPQTFFQESSKNPEAQRKLAETTSDGVACFPQLRALEFPKPAVQENRCVGS
jgi:hypothetical protein